MGNAQGIEINKQAIERVNTNLANIEISTAAKWERRVLALAILGAVNNGFDDGTSSVDATYDFFESSADQIFNAVSEGNINSGIRITLRKIGINETKSVYVAYDGTSFALGVREQDAIYNAIHRSSIKRQS